jgi:hypothetical protein
VKTQHNKIIPLKQLHSICLFKERALFQNFKKNFSNTNGHVDTELFSLVPENLAFWSKVLLKMTDSNN